MKFQTLNYAFEFGAGGQGVGERKSIERERGERERERRSSHEVDNLARQFQAWKMEITQALKIFP